MKIQISNIRRNVKSTIPELIHLIENNNFKLIDFCNSNLDLFPNFINLNLKEEKIELIEGLFLFNNRLSFLQDSFSIFKNIKYLNFRRNSFNHIPTVLLKMEGIERLVFAENQVKSIPSSIRQLSKLQDLILSHNQISYFNPEILSINSLIRLDLRGNPIVNVPLELIQSENCLEALRLYFESIKDEYVNSNEAKVIVLGQGNVGKTSLIKRIEQDIFEQAEETTKGVKVNRINIDRNPLENVSHLNFWDFGGQEIYYSTHQIFLSRKALYVLVTDTINDRDNLEYWLNTIKLSAENSPVIVCVNKIDLRNRELNQKRIKQSHPFIYSFSKVSCKTGENIDFFLNSIKSAIDLIPHYGYKISKKWNDVRTELESCNEDYIEISDFLILCSTFNVQEKEALVLAEFLNDLGVILYFRDDELLEEVLIINPNWSTKAIYSVIDHYNDNSSQALRSGLISKAQLREFWLNYGYKRKEHKYLLKLLLKYGVCFEFTQEKDTYVFPVLLGYQNQKATKCIDLIKSSGYLEFKFKYDFLPALIFLKFICDLGAYVYDDCCWKDGIILDLEESKALCEVNERQNLIVIKIVGNRKKELLSIIRASLIKISSGFTNINLSELISCQCSICADSEQKHNFDYQRLRRRKKPTVECPISEEDLSVGMLMNAVSPTFDKAKLKQLIGQGMLKPVFQFLGQHFLGNSEFIAIEARYSNLNTAKKLGILDTTEETKSLNSIIWALLEFIEKN